MGYLYDQHSLAYCGDYDTQEDDTPRSSWVPEEHCILRWQRHQDLIQARKRRERDNLQRIAELAAKFGLFPK